MKHWFIALGLSLIMTHMASADDLDSCTFNGFNLYGDVEVVTSFPDVKVQIVTSFPDLNVQLVDSFPDIKIQMVNSFPGLP